VARVGAAVTAAKDILATWRNELVEHDRVEGSVNFHHGFAHLGLHAGSSVKSRKRRFPVSARLLAQTDRQRVLHAQRAAIARECLSLDSS